MSDHSARLLTAAIIAALEADGLLVGDGTKPVGGGRDSASEPFAPYSVVYATGGGTFSGSVGVPFDDAYPAYVISSFGASQAQALWGDDKVRGVMLTPGSITLSGRSVMLATPDVDGGVQRDDDVSPPVYWCPTRWRVMTTAAA